MSSSSSPADDKASDRITVKIGGTDKTIFMSLGMLNQITGLVGGVENVPALSFDPEIQAEALRVMLASRDKRGKIQEPAEDADPIVPFDFPVQAAEQLTSWAASHALDFFVRQFQLHARLFKDKAAPLAAVGSSLTSSVTSAGKTA